MRVSKDRIDAGAERMADQMLRYHDAKYGQAPKGREVDAPRVTNAGEPSYYGRGTLPVVSTASVAGRTRGEWSWTLKTVSDLESYGLQGLPIPDAAQCGHKAHILRRGDWDHWEFNCGQHRILQVVTFGVPYVISHATTPIVLTHLEPRDIVCDSYAQAEAECARVGKHIAR